MSLKTIQDRAMYISVGAEAVLRELLKAYPQFEWWSGSHKKELHHYGDGGLIRHTAEVIELGFKCRETLGLEKYIEPHVLFFGALFHDTGKMYDYSPVENVEPVLCGHEWEPNPHRRMIHHLSRSGLIWHDIIEKDPFMSNIYHDKVLHVILSHHGSREAGSPVAPKSREAWLVHMCDGISARMNDIETFDIVKIR